MKNNEPAFPIVDRHETVLSYGMTLRQWYKGMAIGKLSTDAVTEMFTFVGDIKRKEVAKNFAEIIGQLADALLEEDIERKKSGGKDGE